MVTFSRGSTRALVGLVLFALALPGLATLAGIDREAASGENRELASWPRLALEREALRALPDGLTRYFEDHFAFRARLVRWQAALRLTWFGISPSPDVFVGRDGWLFYAADGAADDYAAAVPFSREDLEVWRQTLQHTDDWLRAQGARYLFVIAPDKHAVYPEYLPAGIRRVGNESRIDVLVRYLRDHSTVPVVDVRPALAEAKARERVYHRTDTHWNDRGAFAAYGALLAALAHPGVEARPREAFEPREVREPGMDLAGMLGLTDLMQEDDLRLVARAPAAWRVVEPARPDPHGIEPRLVTEHRDRARPRAVVFRDSFGSALIPFLSDHFSRAVYLWQYNMDPAIVLEERPAVVLQEWVGRRLTTLLPYDGVAALSEGRPQQ